MSLKPNRLRIAISPCPNDTFAFYHFINDTDNQGKYEVVFLDIEELNRGMLEQKWDVVKASFPVGIRSGKQYNLLPSGSAIGFGVGPIAIYYDENVFSKKEWIIGLPGENTTANFLWSYYLSQTKKLLPQKFKTVYMNFAEVMKKTVSREIDMGIVIHEGRFVYKDMNLNLFEDLGKFWQDTTGYPVPLGGIFIKSNLPEDIQHIVSEDLKRSVQKAVLEKKGYKAEDLLVYQQKILPFISTYSQELSIEVIEKHIEYYVNSDTLELSDSSKAAIRYFAEKYKHMPSIKENHTNYTN